MESTRNGTNGNAIKLSTSVVDSYHFEQIKHGKLLLADGRIVSKVKYSPYVFPLPYELRIMEIEQLDSAEQLQSLSASCHQYFLHSFADDEHQANEWRKLATSLHSGRNRIAVLQPAFHHEFFLFPPPSLDCRTLAIGYRACRLNVFDSQLVESRRKPRSKREIVNLESMTPN